MIFEQQIQYLNKLEADFFGSLETAVNQNNTLIENQITEVQLFEKGQDGDQKKLAGYARTTIRIKQRKGQPTDRTTLRDTQAFHNSVTVTGFPLALEITAPVPYTQYLIKRYGEKILVPEKEFMAGWLQRYFIPQLKKDINL